MATTPQPRELIHFLLLNTEEQAKAIRRMANTGWSEYSIAAATRLNVEQVRRILAKDTNVLAPDKQRIGT